MIGAQHAMDLRLRDGADRNVPDAAGEEHHAVSEDDANEDSNAPVRLNTFFIKRKTPATIAGTISVPRPFRACS